MASSLTARSTPAVTAVLLSLLVLLQFSLETNGQCNDFDVRLHNRRGTPNGGIEGSVEMCFNRIWYRLCSNSVRDFMLRPMCNQLFYSNGRIVRTNVPGGAPALVETEIECPDADAPDLRTCNRASDLVLGCATGEQTILECFNGNLPLLRLQYFNASLAESIMGNGFLDIPTGPIPYGNRIFNNVSAGINGVVSFNGPLAPGTPRQFPVGNRYVLAPFWIEANGVISQIDYELFDMNTIGTDSGYLMLVNNYIMTRFNLTTFNGSLLVIIRWSSTETPNSKTYQTVLVTDRNTTYAIYTYPCLSDPPRQPALIGISSPIGTNQFRYSNIDTATFVGCSNGESSNTFSLMYSLTEIQNTSSDTNVAGSCVAAGLAQQSCCQPFTDPTESCRAGSGDGACYCDGLCFQRNDCCSDIHSVQQDIQACVPTCTSTDQSIMFLNGTNSGYPRACINGVWRYVCDNGWSSRDAEHVCSQAQFTLGEIGIGLSLPGGVMYPAGITNLVCNGLERDILECEHMTTTTDACTPDAFATVSCSAMGDCTNGDLRLMGPTGQPRTVEACVEANWRAVCGRDWDDNDAAVICRQLSQSGPATATVMTVEPFVAEVDNVNCTGQETSFSQCQVRIGDSGCAMTAAVLCGELPPTTPPPSSPPTQPPQPSPPPSPPQSTPSPSPMITSPALLVTMEAIIIIVVVITAVIVVLIVIAVVVPILITRRFVKKRKQAMIRLEELSRNTPDPENQYGNNYVKNKLFQGKQQTVSIKPEYQPLISSNLIIYNQQLRLLDSVGQGEFGVVYKAHLMGFGDKDGMTTVAVKTLKGTFIEDDVDSLVKEFLQMNEFQHPNVMGLIGVCLDAGPAPYVVLPFMANGNLLSYLKQRRKTLLLGKEADEEEISSVQNKLLSMCLQITKGMEYLASQKFVHRDLAARNCMIDESGIIKVADFGLAKSTYEKLYFRQDMGESVKLPIKWMAIESIEDGVFSEKTDVWSFGVTCWEIFSGGKMPFGGLTPLSLPKLLRDGDRMEIPDNQACSDQIFEMTMKQCWHADPDDRPTFSELQSQISTALTAMAGYMEFSQFNSVASLDEINDDS